MATPAPAADSMDDKLQQLGELKEQRVLSDAEFEAQQARILCGYLGVVPAGGRWRLRGARWVGATAPWQGASGGPPTATCTPPSTEHSRLACSEVLPDEQATAAAALRARVFAWSASVGITVEPVLTDNAGPGGAPSGVRAPSPAHVPRSWS